MHAYLALAFLVCTSLLSAQDTEAVAGAVQVTLRARICDADGQPLKDGCLVVGRDDEVTTAGALANPDARCGEDGVIELVTTVVPSRWTRLSVMLLTAPGKVAVRYRNPFIGRSRTAKPDAVVDLGEIRLPDGHTMIGRVRQQDGTPIVGARILALDGLAPYPWLAATYGSQAHTDERGVFRMPGVFGSAMTIDVASDGFYDKRFASVDLGTPLDFRLQTSGFVEGVVLDEDGAPVDGMVSVAAEFIRMMRGTAKVENGRFRVSVANRCRFKLTAYGRTPGVTADSELLDGPTSGVTIRISERLQDGFLVRAIDAASGKRLSGIRASALWFPIDLDDATKVSLVAGAQVANRDGVVALSPPEEDGSQVGVLYVAAEGYAPFFAEKVTGKAGGEFVAKMVPGASVRGVVLDAATGKPAAAMTVTCTLYQRRQARRAALRRLVAPVVTGADGAFSFPVLSDGTYELVARRAVGTVTASKRIAVSAAKALEPVELTVPVGATVSGTIVAAPAGAKLVMAGEDASAADNPLTSGASVLAACNFEGAQPIVAGKFRFPHRAAAAENLFLLVPQPPRQGGALLIELAHLHIGEQDEVLTVDCAQHLPGAVSGTVEIHGADVPGGRLVVVATEQKNDRGRWVPHDQQAARRRWCLLGTDGRYAIPLGRGSYTVEVVDSATGVSLLKPGEPFAVLARRTVTRDLKVTAVQVHARFSVENGRLPANRVELVCNGGPGLNGSMTMFGGGQHGSRGFDIPGVDEVVSFYVPPGTVQLEVEPGAYKIENGGISFGGEPLVTHEFEATLGKVHEVVVPLKPAREYPIK